MTEEIEDPFAGAEDTDEVATATTEWLRLEDLDERLVIFRVTKLGTKKGDDGPYEYIEADVIVIDGPPLDLLPTVPGVVSAMHINATGVVSQLKPYAGKLVP